MPQNICAIDGCSLPTIAHGWCNKHYLRWRKYGDPVAPYRWSRPSSVPINERFWKFVDKTEGCWLWTSATTPRYGMFWIGDGKSVYAHRFAYELMIGPIPKGAHVDHLCENRLCVRPDHLEAVTPQINTQRFWESRGHRRDRDSAGRFI